jgi:PAS domain S-box-containing protein
VLIEDLRIADEKGVCPLPPPRNSTSSARLSDALGIDAELGAAATPEPLDGVQSVSRRSQLSLIGGIALITAGLIFTGLRLLDKADHSRLVQVGVVQVEARANLIRSIESEVLAGRVLTSELLAKFRRAESEILRTTQALIEGKAHTPQMEMFARACSDYVSNVDREVALIQAGQLEQAQSYESNEVDPRFEKVQRLVELIREEQSRAAEDRSYSSRIGLITAALFSTATMFLYLRRFSIQQHRAELALTQRAVARKNEDRFRTLTEKSANLILITSAQGDITYISPSVHSVLGWSDRAAIGTSLFERIHSDDVGLARAALDALVALEGTSTMEFRIGHSDGSWPDFECVARNLVHDPNIEGLLLNVRDVTQDKKAQEVMVFNAAHDLLTKLPNRAVFMDRLQKVIERKKRHPGTKAAILFLDLDDLKIINDSLGHDAGDFLINEFGKRMRACVREEDTVARPLDLRDLRVRESDLGTVARLGGDEFIILLEEVRDPTDAIRVAKRIQEAMAEPFVIHDQEVFKGVSIGIAFTSDETDARTIIANADTAMYRAKTNGKSRYEVYDYQMHAQIVRRLDLEKALRQALEGNQFRVQYQPIVSLTTGVIAGFEGLVRWDRPGVGLVPPDQFIPVAEEIGLIVQLGQWVLLEACRQAARWERAGAVPGPYVGVNVSARQFAYPGFVDQVKDALRITRIAPHRLKVELTEGTAMEDPDRAVDVMLQLAQLGVTLSLDDFGTGYSSLSVLRRFPVKTIKIDRSFVSTIHTNAQVAAIVATICGLARILCMEVVAEGLENVEQLEKLRSIFCDYAQGYLFSRPVAAETIPGMLDANLMAEMEGNRPRAASAGD